MSKIVYIGKGFSRLIVTSKVKRERLGKLTDVEVVDRRVIFPSWMAGSIQAALKHKRRPKRNSDQLELNINGG